jgi:4,5-DOPA dioxygenase extradiol
MDRRRALEALLASTSSLLGACDSSSSSPSAPKRERAPVLFLAHGSPYLLDDASWTAELAAWARAIPLPRALLVLSAHWEEAPVTLGATRSVPLVYDFYGFPRRYYQVRYPAPGAPELAARLRALLGGKHQLRDSDRGLDHGAYVPLLAMYPQANLPVLQASLPTLEPKRLFELGQALAPLRDEGVLIVGSGFLTHNMRALDFSGRSPPPAWAQEFDAWTSDALSRRDVDALLDYRARAPGVGLALPTHEHFVPALVALGAAADSADPVRFPISGFCYGSFTRRSIEWG